jgi:preprotein translocase subunit SecE
VTKSNDAEKETKTSGGFNPSVFVQETKEELQKVVWPDQQQFIGESAAVILMVSLSAAVISLVDKLFEWVYRTIFSI